ncbi:MAG: hypothetical protein LBL39_00140 [Planctomycetaceae bacterium]|jgi:hypothetical protein|nr:hypothetical protein [Planctomycetaceae bacterium]
MSHSYKKKVAGGNTTCPSEKDEKRLWHKKFRANELQKLNINNDFEEQIMPIVHEMSDPWSMGKDGKNIYFTEAEIRKDINGYISSLRKSGNEELFLNRRGMIGEFCEYFKVKELNTVLAITNKQKEKFIKYFIKKWRRK